MLHNNFLKHYFSFSHETQITFSRNLTKLAIEQSIAEEIVFGAVQEFFVGNSFYLGIKSSFCHGQKPGSLLDIVKYNGDNETPNFTQETDSSRSSLVANQIIPVSGKFETDVSSIIRSVLKKEDASLKNLVTLENVKSNFHSFVWENLPQEGVLGSSTFSQPTVLLSCDLSHQICEVPDIDKHSRNITSSSLQGHMLSANSSVLSRSTDVGILEHSNKSVYSSVPVEVSNTQQINLPVNEEQARSVKRNSGNLSFRKGKENCLPILQGNNVKKEGTDVTSDSVTFDSSTFDLFDASTMISPVSAFRSPNLPCIDPLSVLSKAEKSSVCKNARQSNPKQALPLQVNISQKTNKYFSNDEIQYSGLFSQEMFTPSPIFSAAHFASTNRNNGSVKCHSSKRKPSTENLQFLGRKFISMQAFPLNYSEENGKVGEEFKDSLVEGSPLLFSDTSCEQSVISPSLSFNIGKASKCLTPDIFESTPRQFLTKKPALSPKLAKNLFKE